MGGALIKVVVAAFAWIFTWLTREVASVLCMVAGLGCGVAAAAVLWGHGWGLMAAAAALVGLSILSGWE
jgi:hypothetical protein